MAHRPRREPEPESLRDAAELATANRAAARLDARAGGLKPVTNGHRSDAAADRLDAMSDDELRELAARHLDDPERGVWARGVIEALDKAVAA
jgi:hypothetical protein